MLSDFFFPGLGSFFTLFEILHTNFVRNITYKLCLKYYIQTLFEILHTNFVRNITYKFCLKYYIQTLFEMLDTSMILYKLYM